MHAVIFDFDGLMVDTETPAFDAWCSIYRSHGAELALEKWVLCVGASHASFDPCDHLMELTGRSLDRAELFAEKERLKSDRCLSQPLMPGAQALLEAARAAGLPCAIASSSSARWVNLHLDRLGVRGHFSSVTTRDDVERVKPHPDLYLKSAARLGVDPEACLVLEDSLNGVRAAKAAGMTCIAVPNAITAALDFSEADAVARSLAELVLAEVKERHFGV